MKPMQAISPCPFCSPKKVKPPAPKINQPLTRREAQILKLVADGMSNQEIAERLDLSLNTIENQRQSLYAKTGVSNTAMAVHLSLFLGLSKLVSFPDVTFKF